MAEKWFHDLFINEAKPALKRHSGSVGDNTELIAYIETTQNKVFPIPYGCTQIASGKFNGFNITGVIIPDTVEKILSSAFAQCNSLTSVHFPIGLSTIGNMAFYQCGALAEVTFAGTPDSIGPRSFDECTNLRTINVPWAEGDVANAPWGASNATINYNHTD